MQSKNKNTYPSSIELDGSEDIASEQVDAEVALFRLCQHFEDLPAGSLALEARIGERLGEHDMNDLLSEQELAAPLIRDDVGNSVGRGSTRLGFRAL